MGHQSWRDSAKLLTSRHQAFTGGESLVGVYKGELVPVWGRKEPTSSCSHRADYTLAGCIIELCMGGSPSCKYRLRHLCLRSAIPIQTLKRRTAIGHFFEKYSHMYVYFCIVKEYANLHRIRFIR